MDYWIMKMVLYVVFFSFTVSTHFVEYELLFALAFILLVVLYYSHILSRQSMQRFHENFPCTSLVYLNISRHLWVKLIYWESWNWILCSNISKHSYSRKHNVFPALLHLLAAHNWLILLFRQEALWSYVHWIFTLLE